ncbi:hypothetical protein Y032_0240g3358 [Ancylostoma ceylanicum]|uniref:Uncharacterized protein n=1 Tax=Ancylostoma ceylanicum TaxID=53326 RepID=A0A016SER8_9BILA|nr:hypothetical protein Y032_0240g3358 [Ancylostoma ceylanicum]
MAMILKRVGNLNTVTLGTFYYNRLKRILPLYYLVLTCGLIALFNFCPLSYWATNVASSRKAVALITNIKTKENATESYEKMLQDAQDLFVHTWSLCVEMQWYLLVPIVFFAQRQIVKLEKTFFAVIAAISIVYYLKVDEITSFYSVFARTWQFCCGLFLGIALSFIIATASYQFFEKNYLKWPPNTILSLIAGLFLSSAYLAMQSNDAFEGQNGSGTVDYSTINVDHAEWNMTLMRLINAKENSPTINTESKGCNYTDRFTGELMKPLGFCSMEDGLIERDEYFARLRIEEVAKRCQKCEIIDYYPVLVGSSGHYLGYNPYNNLLYLDNNNHFNRFGKEKIQPLFDQLSEKFNISIPSPQYMNQCNPRLS